jgi:hypothetical protein
LIEYRAPIDPEVTDDDRYRDPNLRAQTCICPFPACVCHKTYFIKPEEQHARETWDCWDCVGGIHEWTTPEGKNALEAGYVFDEFWGVQTEGDEEEPDPE